MRPVGRRASNSSGEESRPRRRSTRDGRRCSPRSRASAFPPPPRRQFDATRGPDGAFFVGDPETVAAKCLRVSEQLGGVERINLQMTNPRLRHADLLHSIELLGTGVAPLVKS
jgi:alkanesulfonate monooxygenase SsuD/methylene tetrahydromethanopterin reductase-like flavin-dependent oxidoreductase (luciferase family)